MLWQYIVMALIYTLSLAQTNPQASSSHILTQILNHLRHIDQDLTDMKVTVTENEQRIDTRKF